MAHHGFISSEQEELLRRRVKVELRKRLRGVRASTPASACAERSAAIRARLEELPVLAQAKRVALFWPMEERHEVDLRPLDLALRARGVAVAYPSMDRETGVLEFRFVESPEEMEERGSGFREPHDAHRAAASGELDVIVVPAIALDPRGHRIGYGAGYYDRMLPRFAPPAVAVGVAYDYQLVAEIPNATDDVPVTWVVTDKRTLAADARAGFSEA